jgi:hypothetical protein
VSVGRWVIWAPGLAVAVGAAVATAHGLYEVAAAARVPAVIAWLYPLITDGLALVAYAATARLHGPAARYAWSVVVLAAGLSGLAQAAYLAAEPAAVGGPVVAAPAVLRFGIGAWPAVAAAIVAHLLYLLATDAAEGGDPSTAVNPVDQAPLIALSAVSSPGNPDAAAGAAVQPEPFNAVSVQPARLGVQPLAAGPVHSDDAARVQRAADDPAPSGRPVLAAAPVEQPDRRAGGTPARDRARAAAARHARRHGALPTVSELETAAEVSRGTAAAVLKALRDQPSPLHVITTADPFGAHDADPTIEEHTQL